MKVVEVDVGREAVLSFFRTVVGDRYAHSRSSVWMNLSAFPFVRGVYGRVRMWRNSRENGVAASANRHVRGTCPSGPLDRFVMRVSSRLPVTRKGDVSWRVL